MNKINIDVELEIIKKYKSGLSMRKIGIETNLSITTIFNILKRNNIETRTKGGIDKLNSEEIITLYKSGIPSTKIAEKYNVNVHTITLILEKNNITRNNIYHNINLKNDYWEIIDSYDKAYFLGMLLTDGNISGNNVRLQLSHIDKHILEIFANKTNNENSINIDKRGFSSFHVKRKKWVEDLSKYNMKPNKTFTINLPILNDDMMPHLIRGLIDGDGWISKRRVIGFCGNEEMVTNVRDFLVKKLNVYNVKVIKNKNEKLFSITWASKNDFNKICEYIYKDKQDCFLERKYNKYITLIHGNTEVISEIAKGSETP